MVERAAKLIGLVDGARREGKSSGGICLLFCQASGTLSPKGEGMKKLAKSRKKDRVLLKLSEQVRECLETCGQTRYVVARETQIDQAVLSRFATGRTRLSSAALDVLGKYLRLEVVMHGVEGAQQQESGSEQGEGCVNVCGMGFGSSLG